MGDKMIRETKMNGMIEEVHQKAKKVPPGLGEERYRATDLPHQTQLVSFGERVTYTFAVGKEVGSIHFDRGRGEIFFKGHNIRNLDLEEWQYQEMEMLRQILAQDERCHDFAPAYGKILDKIIVEKRRR